MGCFSFICKESNKAVASSSFDGDAVRMYLLKNGKVIEEMRGHYDSYGRVFNPNSRGDSFEWKMPWGEVCDLIFEENESLPRVIASFYSSALYFVNKFGQNQEINFEYWKALDLEGNRNIENCYAYIKKEKSKNTVIHQLDT